MVESAYFRKLHYLPEFWRKYPPRDRHVFLQGKLGACPHVVFQIRLQDATKTSFIQDDDVVQALAADQADQPFHIGILPGRLRSGEDFPNSKPSCGVMELLSIDAIAVAQQIARRTLPREAFQKLPGRPFYGGICRHTEVDRMPTIVREDPIQN
jgi:hypothetical protein